MKAIAFQFDNLASTPMSSMTDDAKARLFGYRGRRDAKAGFMRVATSIGGGTGNKAIATLLSQVATLLDRLEGGGAAFTPRNCR